MVKYPLLIIFSSFCIVVFLFLYYAGSFLVFNKSINKEQNQVIFIFVGTLSDRVLAASELYHATISSKIVYGKTVDKDFEFLDSLGINQCRDTDKIRLALTALNIPDSNIITLDAENRSTIDEANLILDYMKKNKNINKIAIVTSSYHSRRAYLILKNRLSKLNREVFIDSYASTYSHVNLSKWWKKKDDAAYVFTEYAKFISFYIWERW
jgi:uncharacterized SAM-binding protein YcdF (DUF218 family)